MDKHLLPIEEYKKVIRKFCAKNPHNIEVSLKYLKRTCRIFDTIHFLHTVTVDDDIKHRFELYRTDDISKTEPEIKIHAIFIQSIESHVVFTMLDLNEKFNKELDAHGLPTLYSPYNNDNFGFNIIYALYLDATLNFSYNFINELSFPEIPESLNKNKKPVICNSLYMTKC